MADWDGDGIPNIYEIHNGTNPYVPDAALAPRLTVGASGDYASISEALAASTNYSIISLAPETFIEAHTITMPTHPVMLVCEDGYAIVRSSAPIGAFVFDRRQDARTLLRGLYVVLAARSNYQAAFWCGGNLPWSGMAAAPSFENIRVRALNPGVQHFGWHFYRHCHGTATLRNCTINAAGSTRMTGLYIPDFMENVCVTNAGISWNGLALPGSAAWDLGIGDVRDVDFSSTADFDGDGISDYDEVFVYETDPWLADSDGDGLSDGEEIGWGTNPLDLGDFITDASLSVTNATGLELMRSITRPCHSPPCTFMAGSKLPQTVRPYRFSMEP